MNYNWNNHYWQNWSRRISIVEAMNMAQEQVPGEVVKAELDSENGVWIYEVNIITPQGIEYEVNVDINTGRIISVMPD